jgi:hypothetical protein
VVIFSSVIPTQQQELVLATLCRLAGAMQRGLPIGVNDVMPTGTARNRRVELVKG